MTATLTIRNLDAELKARLRLQAAQRGHSMEQEAREILQRALQPQPAGSLAQRIQARFAGLQADALPIPPRRAARLPDLPSALAVHEPSPPPYPQGEASSAMPAEPSTRSPLKAPHTPRRRRTHKPGA